MPMRPYARGPDGTEPLPSAPDYVREFFAKHLETQGDEDALGLSLIGVSEAHGEAEAVLQHELQGLSEALGGADAAGDLVLLVGEEGGEADGLGAWSVEGLLEVMGAEEAAMHFLEGLQEDEGQADAAGDLVLVTTEDLGGAEVLLQVELLGLLEVEGHADVPVHVLTASEDQGYDTNKHVAELTAEVDLDTYVDAFGVADNNDADDPLVVDSTAATERHAYLRFKRDYAKPASVTYSTDTAKPARRRGGELLILQMDADDDEQPNAGATRDSSGWADHATKVGTVALVDGKWGKAYSFTGAGRLEINDGDAPQLRLYVSLEFSILFWFKRNGNPGGEEAICGKKATLAAATDEGWAITLQTDGKLKLYVSDGATQDDVLSNGSTTITDNAWHKVLVKAAIIGENGTTGNPQVQYSFVIDGASNGGDTVGDGDLETPVLPNNDAAAKFTIGAIGAGNNQLTATLDEWRAYMYALADADAAAVLDNPYQDVVAGKTVTSLQFKFKPTASEAVARDVDFMYMPIPIPAALNWRRRKVRNVTRAAAVFPIVTHQIPENTSALQTTDPVSQPWRDLLNADENHGEMSVFVRMGSAAASRSIESKEDGTAGNRPQVVEVLTLA